MRIAIIGAGISGLYAAHRLAPGHDVKIFEAGDHAGGHANTVDIPADGGSLAIDTGFIVFNERNYPLFAALLSELGVAHHASDMSFSFRCGHSNLEYRGDNTFNAIFAQRRNVLRPSFYSMIRDILRFNRSADALLAAAPDVTLGEFLSGRGFSGPVVDDYLLPMAGAIWSADPRQVLDFPACHFGRFFSNHGLLQVEGRPQWRTVTGGSREYVRRLVAPLKHQLRLSTPIASITRHADRVTVQPQNGAAAIFDQVILACHSDQALQLLTDPSPAEREVLAAIRYQDNDIVLHTDERLLPRRRRAWASWNYHRDHGSTEGKVSVTYNLTRLQGLETARQYLVTLNSNEAMDPDTILYQASYAHPVYDLESLRAQARRSEIDGRNRTWYCGAYWGYGFHEDGARSAADVCARLGEPQQQVPADLVRTTRSSDAQLHLSRTG